MTFRLIDDATITFEGRTIEHGVYRQNGDTATVSEPEVVTKTVTLSDGSEIEEVYATGRSMQVDRFTDVEVKGGKKNDELIVTGTSHAATELRLGAEESIVTFSVIPGPGCKNC